LARFAPLTHAYPSLNLSRMTLRSALYLWLPSRRRAADSMPHRLERLGQSEEATPHSLKTTLSSPKLRHAWRMGKSHWRQALRTALLTARRSFSYSDLMTGYCPDLSFISCSNHRCEKTPNTRWLGCKRAKARPGQLSSQPRVFAPSHPRARANFSKAGCHVVETGASGNRIAPGA